MPEVMQTWFSDTTMPRFSAGAVSERYRGVSMEAMPIA